MRQYYRKNEKIRTKVNQKTCRYSTKEISETDHSNDRPEEVSIENNGQKRGDTYPI